jgi:hypothetical protein
MNGTHLVGLYDGLGCEYDGDVGEYVGEVGLKTEMVTFNTVMYGQCTTLQHYYCLPKLYTRIFEELYSPVVRGGLTVWSHPWAAWRVSMRRTVFG